MGYFIQDDVAVPARTPDTHTRLRGLSGGGLRYYIPATGRWASRDLLGEVDRLCLYAHCCNAATVSGETIGLASLKAPSDLDSGLGRS